MMIVSTLYSITALCGLSFAAPSISAGGLLQPGPGIEIHQVKARAAEHPVIRLAATYTRFNQPLPRHIEAAVSKAKLVKRVSSVVNLTLDYSEYLAPVTIGNQIFHLGFGAATADLWVYYTTGYGQRYAPSSTSKKLTGSWSATYGGGPTIKGVLFSDTVQLGTATISSQGVQAATSASESIKGDIPMEGIFGFAFPIINTASPQQKNVFDNLLSTLDKPVFTADLKWGGPGTFGLGFIDSSRYNGSVLYAPFSDKQGFWSIQLSGYGVGSAYKSATATALLDTLSPYMILPDQSVKDYYAKVPGATSSTMYGGWIFPCSATLPSFALAINGTYFTVPGSYMNIGTVDNNNRCYGSLQSSKNVGYNVVGNSFLKSVFVVFDRGTGSSPVQPKVGFASKPL